MKILKRPKPAASQESQSNTVIEPILNVAAGTSFDGQYLGHQNKNSSLSRMLGERLPIDSRTETRSASNEPVTYKVALEGSRNKAALAATTSTPQSQHDRYTKQGQNVSTSSISPVHPHWQQTSPIDGVKNSNSNKKSMKTYQERADEYAKARLRILGSAFPDDEDTQTDDCNVKRILNLDSKDSPNNPANKSVTAADLIAGNFVTGSDTTFRNNNVDCYTNSRASQF